ncbi:hypothetical protein D9M73_119430 [compost metagenome]
MLQIELERFYAVEFSEMGANQGLLAWAIHVLDAVERLGQPSGPPLRSHADASQGIFNGVEGGQGVRNRQRALFQVERQVAHAVERAQALADHRLLVFAVHVVDVISGRVGLRRCAASAG